MVGTGRGQRQPGQCPRTDLHHRRTCHPSPRCTPGEVWARHRRGCEQIRENPMSFSRAAVAGAVHLALLGQAGTAEAQTARPETAAIAEAGRQFSAAYVRGDTDAIMALYTRDAVIFPERSKAISGQDAIRR